MTKYRMTFEIDDECVDSMEIAELRAFAIADLVDWHSDTKLTIINIEEVKE